MHLSIFPPLLALAAAALACSVPELFAGGGGGGGRNPAAIVRAGFRSGFRGASCPLSSPKFPSGGRSSGYGGSKPWYGGSGSAGSSARGGKGLKGWPTGGTKGKPFAGYGGDYYRHTSSKDPEKNKDNIGNPYHVPNGYDHISDCWYPSDTDFVMYFTVPSLNQTAPNITTLAVQTQWVLTYHMRVRAKIVKELNATLLNKRPSDCGWLSLDSVVNHGVHRGNVKWYNPYAANETKYEGPSHSDKPLPGRPPRELEDKITQILCDTFPTFELVLICVGAALTVCVVLYGLHLLHRRWKRQQVQKEKARRADIELGRLP